MPPTKQTRDAMNNIRRSARMIDAAIGEGQRALDLVDQLTSQPPEKVVGTALMQIGRILLRRRTRQR